ncbi:MAG: cell division protein FtsL [Terracidiphilus sp.]|jgi:cell division protein FtsL
MAACVTTFFETGRGWGARIAEHNAHLMASQAQRRRRVRAPEFFFAKHFDNSRLVKAADPALARQIRVFSAAVAVFASLILIYGLQRFNAIENSYRVESEKQTLEQLREENRQLRLNEAELTQPIRIDQMARKYGLGEPQPGQVVHADMRPASGAPTLAEIAPAAPTAQ